MAVKARVRVKGGLAIVETELGEKAVVPADSVCELARDYDLELEIVEGEVRCSGASRRRERVVEVEYDSEED